MPFTLVFAEVNGYPGTSAPSNTGYLS